MALPSTNVIEIETGGSDTLNGGTFDPGNANMATDGAATVANTSAPVFTSGSYNFVAGDVNAWLFIKLGTNWIPGWYQIASVASNAATLSAASGSANLTSYKPNTVNGCATTASPTGATWTIDYSQQGSVAFSLTGLTTSGANAIILTASSTKAMVANGVQVTGGTNFTVGFYSISSVSAGTSLTLDRTCATGVGASGTAGVGGALASLGQSGAIVVTGNRIWLKAGTYSMGNGTANTAGNSFSGGSLNNGLMGGYSSLRGDRTTLPLVQATGGTMTMINIGSHYSQIANIKVDGNGQTAITGLAYSSVRDNIVDCQAVNCNVGINNFAIRCYTNNCTTGFGGGGLYCYAKGGTKPFVQSSYHCIADSPSGDAFTAAAGVQLYCKNCTAFAAVNGFNSNQNGAIFDSCLAVSCTGKGFDLGNAVDTNVVALNCFDYNNTTVSDFTTTVLTGNPFVNSAGSNFALNNTAGAGASCRAAGEPGTFPVNGTIGYLDVGAVQHQDSGGSGTTLFSIME